MLLISAFNISILTEAKAYVRAGSCYLDGDTSL